MIRLRAAIITHIYINPSIQYNIHILTLTHYYHHPNPDGSNRLRIRFNISGPKGHVKVYAEVSDKMSAPDLVYLIIQDQKSGKFDCLM